MISVLVVDDHPIIRHGIVSILRLAPDLQLLGAAADGEEALRMVLNENPDIVLLDLRLPRLDGVEVMRQARKQGSTTRFLVLTTYDTDEYITPALAAGAQGYLLKDAEPSELLAAIRALARGGAALQPGVAARLIERVTNSEESEPLSAREMEVLRLLVAGSSNKHIAVQLVLSENTVRSHVSHILQKLGAQSRSEAMAIALKRGLVTLNRS